MTGSFAAAQTFTGGVRGAVRDANGVIPGVTVELINEAHDALARSGVQRVRRIQLRRRARRAPTRCKATLTGFRTYESKGIRIAHAAVRHARHHARSRHAAGDHHRHRRRAAHRHVERLDRRRSSTRQQLETLPSGGRSAFLFAVTVPTVVASGDSQFNRQQDQTNASLLSLGGGARRANNYLIDGVPITDLRNRATANPTHRGARRRQRPGAPVRRRDRPHRRRHLQRRHQVGHQPVARQRLLPDASRLGHGQQLLSRAAGRAPSPTLYFHTGAGGFGGPIVRNRTFFWVVDRRLRLEHHAQRRQPRADGA